MNGRSTSGTTGLGTVEVSGRSRVPSPPARISACIVEPRLLRLAAVGRPMPSYVRPAARAASGSRKLRPSTSSVPRMRGGDLAEVELARTPATR